MCVCLNLPLPIQKNQNILISKLQIIEIYKVENTKFKETKKKKCIIKKMHLFTVPLNRLTLTHTQFEAEYKQKKNTISTWESFNKTIQRHQKFVTLFRLSTYKHTHTEHDFLLWFSLYGFYLFRVSLYESTFLLLSRFFLCVKPSSILNCKGCGKLPSHSRAHEWDGRW